MTVTLTEHLRTLPDQDLAELLRLRPDLAVPVPVDFGALAARACSRVSVSRCLDGLDRFTLNVLDVLRMTCQDGAVSVPSALEMAAISGVPTARTAPAIDALRARCLVYGGQTNPNLVATVEEVCSPYLVGLGRPAAVLDEATAILVSDPALLRRTLMSAPPTARAALDRLAAGPPIGTLSPSSLARGAGSAVRWLVDAHLLVQISEDTVELPREIGLLLRRDAGPLGPLEPNPPEAETTQQDPSAVDRAAAGQAMEAVRSAEALLEALAMEPAAVLRTGGIGVRDLRRLTKTTGGTESTTALLVEVVSAAGLIGESSSEIGYTQYLPTVAYDGWRAQPIAERWLRLALAWLGMSREPALIGQRDARKIVNALSAEVERSGAPARRRAVIGALMSTPTGTALPADGIASLLAWQAPRRSSRTCVSTVEQTLSEAAAIGVTGLGALACFSRHILADPGMGTDEDDPLGIVEDARPAVASAVRALDDLLPSPVEHVVVQADLTIVVPGPPEPTLGAELALIADQESPNVFRMTPVSIRRALDTGFTAGELHTMLAKRSTTAVPQAVTYLVDDVARQHGGLRVGSAGAFVRSEDETLITEVLANRKLAGLSLRRLAPTVIVANAAVARLMAALREAGYSPVAEDATGDTVLMRPKQRRAPARGGPVTRPPDDPTAVSALSDARVSGIIDRIRRGEAAARAARRTPEAVREAVRSPGPSAQAHTQALAVLQEAVRQRSKVWVGYVDAHGSAVSRLLRPVSIGGGYLRAEDDRSETVHTFALHRITAAVLDEEP